MTVDVEIDDLNKISKRIFDDDVGLFTAETWAKEFNKYVPMDTGTLAQSYTTKPYQVIYTQRYSHYQWEGLSNSGKSLNYNKEKHNLAGSHWEQVAYKDRKNVVAQAISNYIRSK